jgi:hypothetical protein
MRGILVGLAAFAAVVAAVIGYWPATLILTLGIVGHGVLWVRLHRGAPAPVSSATGSRESS